MNKKLDELAFEILKKEKEIKKLDQKASLVQQEINNLENELKDSNKVLSELYDLSKGLTKSKEQIKNEVVKFISQNYYLDTRQVDSLNDLIYCEINKKALDQYSEKISDLIKNYKNVDKNLENTNKKIKLIKTKKESLEKKKKELTVLKKKRIKELAQLKKQKNSYKKKLMAMLKKQESLRKKLQELKIVKKRKVVVNNVKKVGSAYYKPKTANYRGRKTIPPVYGKVVKKFGSYVDPIYKIRIYNDSITIRTKPNSVVRSIMSGKVVYIGNNGDKKVVFIKHKGNLFSIYANLSKVSPLLRKGSYVKKGQIIARVKNNLEFEVTYKDKPINPLKVINLR
jgi:murein DD-endopeptidase MepM/ murein hydrolase activator NlpD